jgi:uncharacterized RDD family membrane protein YckC
MPETSQPVPDQASFPGRMLAAIFDLLVLCSLTVVLIPVVIYVCYKSGHPHATFNAVLYAVTVLALAYPLIPEAVAGRTIGKQALGYRVAKNDGSNCDFKAATIRNLMRVCDVDFLFSFLPSRKQSPNRQRLGDRWAHTIVLKDAAPNRTLGVLLLIACLVSGAAVYSKFF